MPRSSLYASLASILLLAAPLPAQSTFATITGTVTDPAGALVPGVNVTVTNVDTNINRAVASYGGLAKTDGGQTGTPPADSTATITPGPRTLALGLRLNL